MVLVALNGEIGVQEDEPHAANYISFVPYCDMLKQAALEPTEMPQEQPQPSKHKLSPGPNKGIANPQGINKLHLLSPALKNSEKMSTKIRRFLSVSLLFTSTLFCQSLLIPLAWKLILRGRNSWSCCGEVW